MTPRPRAYLDEAATLELALLEVERDRGPARRAADSAYWALVLGRHALNDAGLWGGLCAHFRSISRGQG